MKCEGCDSEFDDNRWAKIKAEGWFFMRDGRAFCPNHVPEWVAGWRKAT